MSKYFMFYLRKQLNRRQTLLIHQNFKSFADHTLAAADHYWSTDHWLGTDDLTERETNSAKPYILFLFAFASFNLL